jgi:hypothetical protein
MKKIILYVSLFFISCSNENKLKDETNLHPKEDKRKTQKELDSLYVNAINNGANDSYQELSFYFSKYKHWDTFFYYALIMANKHDNPTANYDVYSYLTEKSTVNGIEINSNDKYSKNLALFYLLRAYELNNTNAKWTIKRLFKNQKIPKSSDVLIINDN